ncbi:MAG: PAS domain-containing protein [bacterium]|nr:PAS domain-containing protein [bacterium]
MAVQSVAPVLILTGLHDGATGFAAVQKGARDFLAGSHLDVRVAPAGPSVTRIERHRMRREVSMEGARELTASEDRLQRLIASSADGIIITDTDGIVVFANPAAEALF